MEQSNKIKNSFITLADAHVHINECYDLKSFFASAFRNFSFYAEKLSGLKMFTGVLLLTEAGEYNYFKKIFDNPGQYSDLINYQVKKTSEDISLNVCSADSNVIIISGQQIITEEKLEVLALGTSKRFKYKMKLNDTIDLVQNSGAVPVLPWGVGKWTGKREEAVGNLISSRKDFFLGDNGNRPSFWKLPELFNAAAAKGIYNIPGSDPLYFEAEAAKPGSFGFYLNQALDKDYPAEDLKKKILSVKNQFDTYGKTESLLRFFQNQLRIQLNNRLKK